MNKRYECKLLMSRIINKVLELQDNENYIDYSKLLVDINSYDSLIWDMNNNEYDAQDYYNLKFDLTRDLMILEEM